MAGEAVKWALLILLMSVNALAASEASPDVRIGYFHGGRTLMLYRALIYNYYEKENLKVDLLTKNIRTNKYFKVPKTFREIENEDMGTYAKATGTELIDLMKSGQVDAATIGETAFIMAAEKGEDIIAVAELGHDTKESPGHGIIFRNGITIKTPQDMKGLTFSSRRSSGGDTAILKEFLTVEGLDPEKDVKIFASVDDDVQDNLLKLGGKAGGFDGGFYHLMGIKKLIRRKVAWLYRPMNWINPEMSQSLLVFRKSFLQKNPKKVMSLIRAYIKRTRYELALPHDVRLQNEGKKGLEMATDFMGMNFPQYEPTPRVRSEILDQMQKLLVKHKVVSKNANLDDFIDNSFVDKVAGELDAKK